MDLTFTELLDTLDKLEATIKEVNLNLYGLLEEFDLIPVDLEKRLAGNTPDSIPCRGAYYPCGSVACRTHGLDDCPERSE